MKERKGRKRKTRRGRSRKQKKRGQNVPVRILFNNIRGWASKQDSLEEIIDKRDSDIVCVSETNVHGTKKINLKNYFSFTKNNPNKKSMGGLMTAVKNEIKQSAVKVSENSEGDEYIVVRLEHVDPPLNVINIYGQQEGRDGLNGKERVLESWGKLKKEICLIQMRGEAVIICGDYNRAVGADEMGIRGNKERISDGGLLVRNLVEEGEFFYLNNLEVAVGGPWTRVDPADGSLSCLDLALGSTNLLPFVKRFEVDRKRMWTPRRVAARSGVLTYTYTDHFSCEIEILMPASGGQATVEEQSWNTQKNWLAGRSTETLVMTMLQI